MGRVRVLRNFGVPGNPELQGVGDAVPLPGITQVWSLTSILEQKEGPLGVPNEVGLNPGSTSARSMILGKSCDFLDPLCFYSLINERVIVSI